MRIIQEEASEIGARPPVLSGDYKELPIGYMALSEYVDATAMQTHAGFVNLTVEDGVVTAITPNVEAWVAWENSLPAPIEPPAPPPTNTELAAQLAQSDDTAISLYEKQLAQDTINAGMDDALIALYERGGTK